MAGHWYESVIPGLFLCPLILPSLFWICSLLTFLVGHGANIVSAVLFLVLAWCLLIANWNVTREDFVSGRRSSMSSLSVAASTATAMFASFLTLSFDGLGLLLFGTALVIQTIYVLYLVVMEITVWIMMFRYLHFWITLLFLLSPIILSVACLIIQSSALLIEAVVVTTITVLAIFLWLPPQGAEADLGTALLILNTALCLVVLILTAIPTDAQILTVFCLFCQWTLFICLGIRMICNWRGKLTRIICLKFCLYGLISASLSFGWYAFLKEVTLPTTATVDPRQLPLFLFILSSVLVILAIMMEFQTSSSLFAALFVIIAGMLCVTVGVIFLLAGVKPLLSGMICASGITMLVLGVVLLVVCTRASTRESIYEDLRYPTRDANGEYENVGYPPRDGDAPHRLGEPVYDDVEQAT
ncbi:C7 [callitrichine gammaherpesvirus 3]|uniref:C7 n=1 Tax=callitrichine gammaherpesvirus 3 TaxID=106331 RepID=Q8BEN9_9GAMA|nr:C7 [callitrichine gammaherpesvirus 3]AAN64290.1 C7 [callitrichine gammaherpesvirus 3]